MSQKITTLLQLVTWSLLASILILALLSVAYGQARSSNNYQIQSDSINIGGGYSTSSSYVQESTVGEIATGPSDSSSYSLRAGYQQMQLSVISMSAPQNVTMTPEIGGLTGGESNGTTSVLVTTDSPGGYQLSIETETEPAMQKGGDSIADYTGSPDYDFTYGAADALFGFSPEGTDIVQAFLDDGSSACDEPGGSDTSFQCWDGLSTTSRTIATGGSNHPDGATTTLRFRVGVGGSAGLSGGEYVATTTVTAIAL